MIRMQRPSRLVTVLITAGAVAALATGCSAGPNPTPTSPTSDTGVPTSVAASGGTAGAGTAAAQTAAGNPDRCTTAELKGSLGPAEGAAGSVLVTLLLTNTGKRTCELTGFPGVSYVAGDDGHQVGPAATMSGERGGQVRLAPGASAGADLKLVNVANYDPQVCQPTAVRGLRVYPPGDTAALFVPMDGTGCTGTPPGDQISVKTLVAN